MFKFMLILKFIVCLIHVVHPGLVTMASSNMAADQHGSDDEQATATFYMEPKQNKK
jgi:hypothetical protein